VKSNEKWMTGMKYKKPKVVQATTAINAIRLVSKFGTVMDSPSTLPKLTINAYEADE